jgi:hypothetical protein
MSRDFNPAPEDGIKLSPITGDPDGGVDLSAHLADPDPHTGYQKESEKGLANGYASLGSDGIVPFSQRGLNYRSLWIGAGAMTPATTSGAAAATIETATNDVAYDVFKFDGATVESVWFNLRMPDEWDRGTVKAVFFWEPDAGGSGAVTWGISGLADSDDDALDSAPGTEVLVSDSVIAVGDLHITAATAAVTAGGSPALGDMIAFRIRRVPSDAGDTMTQDACLLGVSLQWREGTTEPAAW